MDLDTDDSFDKIICFNFFPHAADKPAFLVKMRNLLASNGVLVIMHDISRDTVNGIHKGCDVVKNDRLPEGKKTAKLLEDWGYMVTTIIDNDEMYFIKAVIRTVVPTGLIGKLVQSQHGPAAVMGSNLQYVTEALCLGKA